LKLTLAAIDLSAWKFPAPCHVGARRALRDQHAPGRIEQPSGDHSNGMHGED
jgi:hypothetical protein